jgi:nucleoside-diphosphate-sugar epimerase
MSRVLMVGAGGYIGSAVAAALAAHGYTIAAVTRGAAPPGYDTIPGDLTLPGTLAAAVRTIRPAAVVHAGVPTGEAHTDVESVQALMEHQAPMLYTSGCWFLGVVGDRPFPEEHTTGDSARARTERAVLAGRGTVIRPGVVYGRGGGIPAEMVGWARSYGTGRHVGPAGSRWPTVHVDDLADLFVLALGRALEGGGPGGVVHGAGEAGVRVGDIAAAADVAAGGPGRAEEWPVPEAGAVLGAGYAASLAMDQVVAVGRARAEYGWRPTRPGIVDELATGDSYRAR